MTKKYKLTKTSSLAIFGQLAKMCSDGGVFSVAVKPWQNTRSLIANKKMWACLSDVSKQIKWPVNGQLSLISADDWKDIISAGLKKESRIAQGIDGGYVILGERTSKMTIAQMSEMIELIYAFGANNGVVWGETIPAEYLEFARLTNDKLQHD